MAQKVIGQVLHGLGIGGAEVLAARLARRLGAMYRFVFLCLDELGTLGEELAREGVAVHVLGRRGGVDCRCSIRLARLLRRERVDLVHAHQYTPFFYGATARLLFRRPPVLFTEHGRWSPDYPRPKRMIANRILLEPRDRVVGVGEAVRQALIRNEKFPPRRVDVIHNGVDLSAFQDRYDREAIRRELNIGSHELVLIQVGRLDPLKDHATAIRSLGHVLRSRPDARLVLVGEGPLMRNIQDEVHRHQFGSSVRILGLRHDIARLLAAADLALLTSISEGIPLTLIEAMAAGLPVVSTRVGGVGEVVEDGRTGLLAPAGDDAALAGNILRLADDPGLRDQMGRLGRRRAEAFFSEEQMHAGYLRLYDEMLRG